MCIIFKAVSHQINLRERKLHTLMTKRSNSLWNMWNKYTFTSFAQNARFFIHIPVHSHTSLTPLLALPLTVFPFPLEVLPSRRRLSGSRIAAVNLPSQCEKQSRTQLRMSIMYLHSNQFPYNLQLMLSKTQRNERRRIFFKNNIGMNAITIYERFCYIFRCTFRSCWR